MKRIVLGILSIILLSNCNTDSGQAESTDSKSFNEVASEQSGITFANVLRPDREKNIIEYLYYFNGGGVAIGDLDGDGLEDVYLTANQEPDAIYKNTGGLTFENRSTSPGILQDSSWSSGVTIDDVNGDGLLDIYVCKVKKMSAEGVHNLLYINKGNWEFEESSKELGVDFQGFSTQASFFDYDKDGDLDMYLLNHSVHSVRSYGKSELRNTPDPEAGDRLFENRLNEAEKKFVDVTAQANIYSSSLGYGLAVSTSDINGDGWIDIYVGNDFHENDYIYINNQDGTFTESQDQLIEHSTKFTMGVDVADISGDGKMDIFTTDMLPYARKVALKSGGEDTDQVFDIREDFGFDKQYARNHLQIQNSQSGFRDIALATQTYATDWSWGVLLQDFDNDGLKDIFISNGILRRPNDLDYINYINKLSDAGKSDEEGVLENMLALMPSEKIPNVLFRNLGDHAFSPLQESFVAAPSFSNGTAYADFDKDGDLDIITNNLNGPVQLLENKSAGNGHYLSIALSDDSGTAKGAVVTVQLGDKEIIVDYNTVRGYQSSSSHYLHFGLGNYDGEVQILTTWPDGKTQIDPSPVDKEVLIRKRDDLEQGITPQVVENKTVTLPYQHRENPFKDYNFDKLIPESISAEGPAIARGDIDGDGYEDLYIGGARFQEATLLYGSASGAYTPKDNIDVKKDAKYEDVDALFFDFENDGDLDLYVVSGGSDVKELDKMLEDRLYLNEKGKLFRVPLSLPHTNGSTVTSADYNGDGYADLFVGARSIPKSYGLSPFSFVLTNKKGKGVDIGLKSRIGMVTDAVSYDIDGDKDQDILVCGDWMKVTVLENDGKGTFTLNEELLQNGNGSGLWNALEITDVNNDGKADILAGNVGKNFKWQVDSTNTVQMYVADLDKNGQPEPIIFAPYFDGVKSFYSLEKLVSQAPILRKKFQKYSDFSSVEKIEDIIGEDESVLVDQKELTELKSKVWLSSENGYLSHDLPKESQLSTIQDFIRADNGEVLYVNNHLNFLTELGVVSGESGGVLSWNDEKKGLEYKRALDLPNGLNTREIIKNGKDGYIVTCNNDRPHLIKK